MSYSLPELPYAYDALEPHFDKETMNIHHTKHHQAYVTKLNAAIEGTDAPSDDIEAIIKNISKYGAGVRNNGGGHYNHSLFWEILSPTPKKAPEGKLAEEINKVFGSLDAFKEQFNNAGATQFGSGWAWLFVKYNGTIGVTSTANQDNPLMDINETNQGFPILGVDVWEHAYYLKYQNKRPDYLNAFWDVLDWAAVEKKYEEVISKLK
ncbi:MAG: superoxide dismutase [Flammeovirgaceae bacterium]|nr:superoxide dismutase [Flammeovirgaceae bacterium]MBR10433.1 superoxide dismutase [Rickettsiales bacterium]|tara:strand:- start:30 stop:653 length:624 start_codon:yes stop_codon:yes gene_type:complete